jgi:hypothetical protein
LFIFLLTYAKQQFGLGQTDRKTDEMVNRKINRLERRRERQVERLIKDSERNK